MAELKQRKEPLRRRAARKVVNAAGGGAVADLTARIAQLEAEVQENRAVNVRVAELIDLVSELMLPMASQDREQIEAALAKFQASV